MPPQRGVPVVGQCLRQNCVEEPLAVQGEPLLVAAHVVIDNFPGPGTDLQRLLEVPRPLIHIRLEAVDVGAETDHVIRGERGADSIVNVFPVDFLTGLLFRNMDARAAIAGLVWGVALYAFHNFILYVPDTLYAGETFYQHIGIGWLHYIDVMAIVLVTCVLTALTVNRIIFGNRAVFIWSKEGRRLSAIEA